MLKLLTNKKTLNIFVIFSSVFTLVFLMFSVHGPYTLLKQFKMLNYNFILLAFVFMFLDWLFEALILQSIIVVLYKRQPFFHSLRITMIGQFFNAITPMATGGQPAQLVALIKSGIKTGHAGSILMIKFIVFQVMLTLYTIILMFSKLFWFHSQIPKIVLLAVIGLSIRVLMILISVLFSYNKVFTHKILMFIFNIIKYFRPNINAEKAEQKIENELMSFHKNALKLKNHKKLLPKVIFLSILQFTCYFVIPYFIYLAFGLKTASMLELMSANAFVATIASIVPLPGAIIGAEGSFYMFFGMFFNAEYIILAILIWRLITYYSCIAFGSLFTISKK